MCQKLEGTVEIERHRLSVEGLNADIAEGNFEDEEGDSTHMQKILKLNVSIRYFSACFI
jgi:hypothetical protein